MKVVLYCIKRVLKYEHCFQDLIIEIYCNCQLLKRDMDQLDAWLNLRKPVLEDKATGDSIDAVEELLQKHDDFEKMVFAQEDRFNSINRITLVSYDTPCVPLCFSFNVFKDKFNVSASVVLQIL